MIFFQLDSKQRISDFGFLGVEKSQVGVDVFFLTADDDLNRVGERV